MKLVPLENQIQDTYRIPEIKFKREEQESLIRYDSIDKEWQFYSCVPSHIKKYLKSSILNKGEIKVLSQYNRKQTSIEFKIKEDFVVNNFLRPKRHITDEHKKALLNGRKNKLYK